MKIVSLLLILSAAFIFSACAGHTWESPLKVVSALFYSDDLTSRLLTEWRLPRVITAGFTGALLGLSGAIFQGVFRNPLAEPWLLGSSGGAAIGGTVALLVPLGLPLAVSLPLFAFSGALAAIFIVLSVSRIAGSLDTATLLLTGVAVSAVLNAARSFMMMALSDESTSLQVVLSWILGGIQTPSGEGLIISLILTLTAILLSVYLLSVYLLSDGLDLMGLDRTMAMSFGLSVERFTVLALIAGSAIVAIAVSLGGVVGFIGLIAPHIARWQVGARHKYVLPASAVIGAALVMFSDALSRSLLPPGEIPLGLITAFIGGPFFIYLLAKRVRKS